MYGIRKKTHTIFFVTILTILSLIILVPMLYVLSVSFSTDEEIVEAGYQLIPKTFSLNAYQQIFATSSIIFNAYAVTIFVTVVGTIMSLYLTTTIAYAASRKDFKYRKFLNMFLLFPLLFNGGMVSSFIVNTQILHLDNKIWALILPYGVNVWYAFMMKGFLSNLPFELIEAAHIDGAGEYQVFFKIILPISTAALATIGLFYAFAFWNDWWLAMLYINKNELMPLQQLLQRMLSNIEFYLSMMPAGMKESMGSIPVESTRMALTVIVVGPMLLVFPFFQKYFVKGVTVGSVKG